MPDLRKHPRFRIAGPAVISVIGRRSERLEGRIANLSEGGVQLRLPRPIALGEAVQVEIQDVVYLGVVRHSEPERNQWLIGIELHNWIAKSKLDELLRFWGPPANLDRALNDIPRGAVSGPEPRGFARQVVTWTGNTRHEIESERT